MYKINLLPKAKLVNQIYTKIFIKKANLSQLYGHKKDDAYVKVVKRQVLFVCFNDLLFDASCKIESIENFEF